MINKNMPFFWFFTHIILLHTCKFSSQIADYALVYTEHARRHLISEGLPHRRIYFIGSPLKEVLDHYQSKIDSSGILSTLNLIPKEYFMIGVHREENVDNLLRILKAS